MSFTPPENYIAFSPPLFGPEEEEEVIQALRSGWITTGPRTAEFEKKVASYSGAQHAIGAFSCTDAMLLGLKALGLQAGDEVITTPYTFVSTGHVICHHQAKPVFVDVEPDTFNIDPQKIEAKITSKTKGIMPVHYAGHPCDMDPILEIAKKHNLFILEDAAHAIGSTYKGRSIGSIGDVTCFSYYATKNLATAEGGMALTNNEDLAKKIKILTMYGISDAREIWQKRYSKSGNIHYDVPELGYKCNMTDMVAALGLHQLAKLDDFNAKRNRNAEIYNSIFSQHEGLVTPIVKDYATTNRHLYPILLDLDRLNIDRDTFVDTLKGINIGTSVLFVPLHYHTYYQNLLQHDEGDFPIAESLFERSICLPVSPVHTPEMIEKVAEGVIHLLEKHKR